ncbi:MAG: hypothetical protein QOG53_3263 [Frankiales bacterium]|jgi:hypothetical protein|nr:hypothetical protein [Frankiales bacterium]
MTASDFRNTAADIAAALRAVPGVADAEVEPDEDGGGVGLLRLGLVAGVDEVRVATDVGRLLREQFGLGVDAERVQLVEDAETGSRVEPEPDADADSEPAYRKRPAIQRMHLVSSGLDVTATVTLSYAGKSASGEATGTATQSGVQRAVAMATLHSVEQLIVSPARFELEHIEITPTGRDRTVVVAVTMLGRGGSERLTGAAAVREDVRQAVIRATLAALNRRLEPLLP